MQVSLINRITMMNTNHFNLSSMVNLTISVEGRRIIRIMFRASVRSERMISATQRNNRLIAMKRVNKILTLQRCTQNVQPEFKAYSYNWDHCSELILLSVMHEKRNRHVILFFQTINLKQEYLGKIYLR